MILHTLKGYKTIGQRQCLAPFDNTHFDILFAHHYSNLCPATLMISLFLPQMVQNRNIQPKKGQEIRCTLAILHQKVKTSADNPSQFPRLSHETFLRQFKSTPCRRRYQIS